MDARGSRLLRNSHDQRLYGILYLKHKVCKLVDNDNDLGKGLSERAILLNLFVIRIHVSYRKCLHGIKSAIHLLNRPHKRACGLLGIRYYGNEKVRNTVVHSKFNLLRVDHNKLDLVGARLVKHADKQRVDTNRLTHTGSTRDKQMGHLCKITEHGLTCNVATDTYEGLGFRAFEICRFKQIAKSYNAGFFIGDLNTHRRLTGDGCLHSDRACRKVEGDIVLEIHDLAYLDALSRNDLVSGDSRSSVNTLDRGGDTK